MTQSNKLIIELVIKNPCNCGAAEDKECRSVGCSGAQIGRLNMLNKRIAEESDLTTLGLPVAEQEPTGGEG